MYKIFKNFYRKLNSIKPKIKILSFGCCSIRDSLPFKESKAPYNNADILILSGKTTEANEREVSDILKKVKKECIVIIHGNCTKIKADIHIHGCPPSKEVLTQAIKEAKKRLSA